MVTEIAGLAGICVSAVIICRMLEKYSAEYIPMTALAVCGICVFAIIKVISPLLDLLQTLTDKAGLGSNIYEIILKSLGICIITQLAADICRDSRETAMAGAIELMGRISVLLLCIPLIEKLLEIVEGLITL